MEPRNANALRIVHALASELIGVWDGREAIKFLKDNDYQWKQMEWIGWYFELRAKQILKQKLGGQEGPVFGNVSFDFSVENEPWDFKSHPIKPRDAWMYLNDVEAVDSCVISIGSIGWVVAMGNATYDLDGSFKEWHDSLKGPMSAYEVARKGRGARSRPRKVTFQCTHFLIVKVDSKAALDDAVRAGLMKGTMQVGQRNADGKARRPKYGLHVGKATHSALSTHLTVFTYPAKPV